MFPKMLDGNWIDMLTISCGIVGIFVKPGLRRIVGKSPAWVHKEAANDFLNAASIAPFALLIAAPFNNWIFAELTTISKVSLGLAGGIGVLYVMKEIFSLH